MGLPDTITSNGVAGAVSFARLQLSGGTDGYYAPTGFAGTFDQNGNPTNITSSAYASYRTFLQFDFSPTGRTGAPIRSSKRATPSAALRVRTALKSPRRWPTRTRPPTVPRRAIQRRQPFDGRRLGTLAEQADRRGRLYVHHHQERRRSESESAVATRCDHKVGDWPSLLHTSHCFPEMSPPQRGCDNLAQGCRVAATLGWRANLAFDPAGVARTGAKRNPVGVLDFSPSEAQGSRCAATLGSAMTPLRG